MPLIIPDYLEATGYCNGFVVFTCRHCGQICETLTEISREDWLKNKAIYQREIEENERVNARES